MSLTLAEQLIYTTFRLNSGSNGRLISTGTGFFMNFVTDNKSNIPAIITNKHVISDADNVSVVCHLLDGNSPSGRHINCIVPITEDTVVRHSSDDVDLCAILFGQILQSANERSSPIFFQPLGTDIIPKELEWKKFDAIEDVTMIGCPRGISDEVNNFPIVRKGITATALSQKYNGKSEFLVDMACFPGSSGSPIFLYDRHGFFDREINANRIGVGRLKLVGILYSGPLINNEGEIILGRSPKVSIQSMMHLGYALRSTEIFDIEDQIRQRFSN